jgi:hypothetical protein
MITSRKLIDKTPDRLTVHPQIPATSFVRLQVSPTDHNEMLGTGRQDALTLTLAFELSACDVTGVADFVLLWEALLEDGEGIITQMAPNGKETLSLSCCFFFQFASRLGDNWWTAPEHPQPLSRGYSESRRRLRPSISIPTARRRLLPTKSQHCVQKVGLVREMVR